MNTIIENINDYVLGECTAQQCGFSENEVNEIFSTLISESRKKTLENAVKALTDEEYDEIVEKIAKVIQNARQARSAK
jgi:broad-specificity NMP kinase